MALSALDMQGAEVALDDAASARLKAVAEKVFEDREVFRKLSLTNFFDLLVGSAASPAMLTYLNNTDSTRSAPNISGTSVRMTPPPIAVRRSAMTLWA